MPDCKPHGRADARADGQSYCQRHVAAFKLQKPNPRSRHQPFLEFRQRSEDQPLLCADIVSLHNRHLALERLGASALHEPLDGCGGLRIVL